MQQPVSIILPLNCRTGWELLSKLEKYGCKVPFPDLLTEDEIIRICIEFYNSPIYKSRLQMGVERKNKIIEDRKENERLIARKKLEWRIKKTIERAWG